MSIFHTPEKENQRVFGNRLAKTQNLREPLIDEKHVTFRNYGNMSSPSRPLRLQNNTYRVFSPQKYSELGVRNRIGTEGNRSRKASDENITKYNKYPPAQRSTPSNAYIKDQEDRNNKYQGSPEEEEFKLFYSVSKILDDSLTEQNAHMRSPNKKPDSPGKIRLITNTLTDINDKLEDLKGTLSSKAVRKAISNEKIPYAIIK